MASLYRIIPFGTSIIDLVMSRLGRMLKWHADVTPLTPATTPPQAPNLFVQPVPPGPKSIATNAEKLVAAATFCLGNNLSIGMGVDPHMACAISVNRVHYVAFGTEIGGGASTLALYQKLLRHPSFRELPAPAPGCIVISPTGYGKNPSYPHGHCGIMGGSRICANDSASGLWSSMFADIAAWKQQYEIIEGFPTYYFQRV